jgi:hypothetical protein
VLLQVHLTSMEPLHVGTGGPTGYLLHSGRQDNVVVAAAAAASSAAGLGKNVPGLQRMALQAPSVQDPPVHVDGDHLEQLLPVTFLAARRAFAAFLPYLLQLDLGHHRPRIVKVGTKRIHCLQFCTLFLSSSLYCVVTIQY